MVKEFCLTRCSLVYSSLPKLSWSATIYCANSTYHDENTDAIGV